jgi:N-acetylmuramoyl-L-alanine amidase
VRGYEDDMRQTFPNNAYDEQNLMLAANVHRSLIRHTLATDRGLRRARFMGVLRGQNRPAVLIEAGYLSNAAEARKISTPEYRQLLAEAIAAALD